MRRLLLLLPLLLVLLPLAPAAGADAAGASRARPAGRWVLDGHGRVLVLDGVNMVAKRAPYAPDQTGFGRDDARFLARHGLTLHREVLTAERDLWTSVGAPAARKLGKGGSREPVAYPRGGPGHDVVKRLDSAIDRMDRLVAERRLS